MKFILNGINGEYLRSILNMADGETESVDAAVAYATDASLLFDWCWAKGVMLRYWGRFDDGVPVSVPILKNFLERRSPNFSCKLLRHFHAKVIWWRGCGAYIGSANLTGSAWFNNVEAGVFIPESELAASGQGFELEEFFRMVDQHASPLTDELYEEIQRRAKELHAIRDRDQQQRRRFEGVPFVHPWPGLATVSARSVEQKRKAEFLQEWNGTLQILRDLAVKISKEENRPRWVEAATPRGAQADQFLHAHYYTRTFQGGRAHYEQFFERNRTNPEGAERETMEWWRSLDKPPTSEGTMLYEWSPFLRERLAKRRILELSELDVIGICLRVNAIRDHARRVSNVDLGLTDGRTYTVDEKAEALGRYLWSRRAANGHTILQLIHWVLYSGSDAELPERLWEAVSDQNRRIEHFGISALGELVGWALPDTFPPRNGRTSKALRSLGYDVAVHA